LRRLLSRFLLVGRAMYLVAVNRIEYTRNALALISTRSSFLIVFGGVARASLFVSLRY
jgi:hypothetical protein